MSRVRSFCFTTYEIKTNDPKTTYERWNDRIGYLVYQEEECPKTKKHHYQGYCELKNAMTYSAIKRLFDDDTMHLEPRKGTPAQAAAYCKKEDTRINGPWEFGEISQQGKRSDIQAVADLIREGKSIREVAEEHPATYIKMPRGIRELHNIVNKPKERPKPIIEYHWGEPGAGKSKYAHSTYPNAYAYIDNPNGWFDGYEGEEEVILDDFEGKMPRALLLKLLDYYPHRMPVKGGFVPIKAYKFIFTSNSPPTAYYDEAFQRRLKDFGKIVYYQKPPEQHK